MKVENKTCAVIPVYRHGKTLRAVIKGILKCSLPVVIVDDGNDEETKAYIRQCDNDFEDVHIVELSVNLGKGGAVMAGLLRAEELGFTHAFQVDADGQHDLSPIQEFLEESGGNPNSLICGYPVYDDSVPSSRKNGRKITNFWVTLETLSRDIRDAMCGFRLYPLSRTCRLIKKSRMGKRMTFDIDILIRLSWAGVPMKFLPINVIYPEDGISNFRMVKDNIAISGMHAKLFFGMIPRIPIILIRRLKRSGC
ncbi:MAG: glycosyltransferase family 2 protein [Spirochaetales bacterium]|nr:glycosyltransferase family 2 protein [Spirochaetales bacterium]